MLDFCRDALFNYRASQPPITPYYNVRKGRLNVGRIEKDFSSVSLRISIYYEGLIAANREFSGKHCCRCAFPYPALLICNCNCNHDTFLLPAHFNVERKPLSEL